jgi:non-specific serine/threonine protein kinase/serine/threonine-protein kinase
MSDDHPITEKMDSGESRPGGRRDDRLLGNYRLLQKLGEGGMGEVWQAEQLQPVQRQVALKLIKRGMDSEQVLARFETERQALALMDHPAIAKVFDAGTTERGRPFFVMELVHGVPITTYCDRHRKSVRERLELFVDVCEAIRHAHQKAVIHRDIKPSNILITESDGRPVPKIIDFGVAKATAKRLTERTLFTEFGELVGTPEYMSPEQAELTGENIDIRTDVYSLGMVLYELLAGALPIDSKALRKEGLIELQRIIREEDPPKPSTKVSHMDHSSATTAESRRTSVPDLVKSLRGDLDWIVIRCLEKDRSRRYDSPQEIAADIRRHLADEPVLASPPSLSYRTMKFVRRHFVGVVSAAVLVVGLIVGTVGATVGLMRARRAEEKARLEARSSETVTTVLTGMLAGLDPEAAGELLARDVRERVEAHWREQGKTEEEIAVLVSGLDRAMEGVNVTGTGLRILDEMILSRSRGPIEENLAEHPQIAARLEHTVGRTYGILGLTTKSEPHLLRALDLRTRALGPDHPDTLGTMNSLAVLYWVQGRYDEAEPLFLATIEASQRVLGRDHPSTLASMHNLATLYNNQGLYDKAEPLFLETLEKHRRVLGEDHPNTLGSMNNLAFLYSVLGRYGEAEPLFLETLETEKRALGEDHPDTLGTMSDLAALYIHLGRYEQAEPLILEAFENQQRVLGDDHPDTLGTMNILAALYSDQGRYDQAGQFLLEALEIQTRVLGEDHPVTLTSKNLLGRLYANTERLETAEVLLRDVLDKRLQILGEHHPDVGDSYYSLGCLAAARKNYDESMAHLRRATALGWSRSRIVSDPSLDGLRGTPEFESIVAKVTERLDSQG